MKELIVEQIKITFTKAIKKFAKKDKVEAEDVSILFKLEPLDAVDMDNVKADVKVLEAYVCHNHNVSYKTKLQDIMGLTLTLSGIGSLVQAHIHTIIESFAEKHEGNIELCVYLQRDDEDDVSYFVYSNGSFISQFSLIDVLKI
jgi:hypothetical protein